jgi:hypothetical protein
MGQEASPLRLRRLSLAGLVWSLVAAIPGWAQAPGEVPHPPPAEDRCTWTVVTVGAKSLSATGGCEKEPKVVFPVEASALAELKKVKPGAWVFLGFRETSGRRTVISIKIMKPGASTTETTPTPSSPSPKRILYVRTDLPCSVSIDGKPKATLAAGGATEIAVDEGQHVVTAVGEGGGTWEQIVEANKPRTVVDIKIPPPQDANAIDRSAAGVWVALTDLRTAGTYAGSVAFGKSFGFHDANLLATIHAANESVRRQVEDGGTLKAGDSQRQKVLAEVKRTGEEARKYADLLSKAITMAQDKNTALGEPMNLYGQAKALESGLTLSPEVMESLRASQAFRAALPLDLLAKAGLPADPKDFRLGADYCVKSTPLMLAVVESGGLADTMGFEPGDQLVSAAGKPLASVWEFKQALRENLGRRLTVAFTRKGKSRSAEIKVPAQLS